MKNMLLLSILLLVQSTASAGWFDSAPDPLPEYRQKIVTLENQVSAQNRSLDQWQIAAGSLGLGCALLFVLGTALGATTRKHYDGTRRVGSPTNTPVNGRKPKLMGQASQDHLHTPLAA